MHYHLKLQSIPRMCKQLPSHKQVCFLGASHIDIVNVYFLSQPFVHTEDLLQKNGFCADHQSHVNMQHVMHVFVHMIYLRIVYDTYYTARPWHYQWGITKKPTNHVRFPSQVASTSRPVFGESPSGHRQSLHSVCQQQGVLKSV